MAKPGPTFVSPGAGVPWLAAVLLLLSCSSPWERCRKEGGLYFTGPASLPPARRRGVCLQPAPDADKPCRDRRDCSILCLCPAGLSGPDDGGAARVPRDDEEAVGTCAAYPVASGSGWQCIVDHGRVVREGIIVD